MFKYEVAVALLYLEFGFECFCTNEAEKVLAACPAYISRSSIIKAERKGYLQYIRKKEAKQERESQGKYYHHGMVIRRVAQKGYEAIQEATQDDRILTKFFLRYSPRFCKDGVRRY